MNDQHVELLRFVKQKSCFLLFRDEIALCIEKAYEKIRCGEASRMLFFDQPKAMTAYAEEVG